MIFENLWMLKRLYDYLIIWAVKIFRVLFFSLDRLDAKKKKKKKKHDTRRRIGVNGVNGP